MNGANDEDWSIISSSSELDDERLTSGSILEPCEPPAAADASIGTLRLPSIDSSFVSETPVLPEPACDADRAASLVPAAAQRAVPADRSVGTIINFYESLSANTKLLHSSLKKKSDSLYQQVARPQLENFNSYLERSEQGSDKRQQRPWKPHVYTAVVHHMRNPVKSASNWMELHSEYLLHFVALALVLLVGLGAFAMRPGAAVAPDSLYESVYARADRFFFEEQVVLSKYFGLVKARARRLRHVGWLQSGVQSAARVAHSKSSHVRRFLGDIDVSGWLFLAHNSARSWWAHSKTGAARLTHHAAAGLKSAGGSLQRFSSPWTRHWDSQKVSASLERLWRHTNETWAKVLVHGRRWTLQTHELNSKVAQLVANGAAVSRPWIQSGSSALREGIAVSRSRSGEAVGALKKTLDTASVWVYSQYVMLSSS